MKQKVFFIVCIKFHGCFLESTNYYDGLFNRVIKKNSDKRHMALKQQHTVQDSRNGDKQHKDGLKLTAAEKNANTIVKLTDSNMALTSSIRKMTSFVIQTREIHNSPKRACLNVCRLTIYGIPMWIHAFLSLFTGYQASNSSYNISLVEKSGVARAVVEVSC